MGWAKYLVLLFLISLSLASAETQSGDNGVAFAAAKSAQMCASDNVQAVYVCNGNVVRVVSSVPGQGSTFYLPDGQVVQCPIASPTNIGGQCMELLMPNFCQTDSKCGNATMPQVFPGQNNSAEQSGNATYYIIPGQAANGSGNDTAAALAPEQQNPQVPKINKAVSAVANDITIPTSSASGRVDSIINYLVYVVLFLGIVSVGVLFMLFRNSLVDEDEAA